MTPGIHLLHKPVGPTSFAAMRSFLADLPSSRELRACHGGALDPFASGLLLVLVEPATKLFDHLHAIPKIYRATVKWGVETDNGDPLGAIVSQSDVSHLTPDSLNRALETFIGWHDQTPPATSNKRIGGERAYLKAHRGETVLLQPVRVYLHEARWVAHQLPVQSELLVTVRGGFFVRALARDLGRALGCGAHLSKLSREAIGPWRDPGPGNIVAAREILTWLPSRALTERELNELRQKREIPAEKLDAPTWPLPPGFPGEDNLVRGMYRGKFCFLLRANGDRLAPHIQIRGGL